MEFAFRMDSANQLHGELRERMSNVARAAAFGVVSTGDPSSIALTDRVRARSMSLGGDTTVASGDVPPGFPAGNSIIAVCRGKA
jgi:hypothetical protein